MRRFTRFFLLAPWLILFVAAEDGRVQENYNNATHFFNIEEFELAAEEYLKVLSDTAADEELLGKCSLKVGECHFQLKKYGRAKDQFREYLQKFPQHSQRPIGQFRISESFYFLKEYDAASKSYARFILENPQHEFLPLALYAAASASVEVGQFESALSDYQRLAREFPKHEKAQEALFNVGWVYFRDKKFVQAAETFTEFHSTFPHSKLAAEALLKAADAQFRADDYTKALALYNRVLAEGEGAFTKDAHRGIAWSYYKLKEHDKAARSFKILADNSEDVDGRAQALFLSVQSFYNGEKFAEGHKVATELIQTCAGHKLVTDAWYWKGIFEKQLKQYDEALASLKQALQGEATKVEKPEVLHELAGVHAELGQYEEATKLLEDARKLAGSEKNMAQILHDLSRYYHLNQKSDMAIEVAKAALSLAGSDQNGEMVLLTRFNLGEFLFAKKDYATALEHYQWVLRSEQAGPEQKDDARYRLGWCYKFMDKQNLALENFSAMNLQDDAGKYVREVRYLMAELHELAQRLPEAVKGYKALTQARGAYSGESYLALARLEFLTRNHEQVIALMQEFLGDFPGNILEADGHYLMAESAYELKRSDLALKHYSLAIDSKKPEVAERALYGRAWLNYERSNFDPSLADLERLVREFPLSDSRLSALQLQGRIYASTNRLDRAREIYENGLKSEKGAAAEQFVLSLAGLESDAKRYNEALELYDRFIRTYPTSDQMGRALFEKGWLLMQTDRVDEALQVFELYERNHADGDQIRDVKFAMGELAYGKERYKEALTHYEKAMASNLHKDKALYKAAWCHFKLGSFLESAGAFARLAAECPDSPLRLEAIYRQGQSLIRNSRFDEAIPLLENYLKQADKNEGVYREALFNLATVYEKVDRLEEARGRYEDYILIYPDAQQRTDAEHALGLLHYEHKRFAEALKHFGKASEDKTHPKAQSAFFWLAECEFAEGRSMEAIKSFLKTLLYESGDDIQAKSLYRIAQCYKSLGQPEKITKYLDMLKKDFPNSPETAQLAAEFETK